MRINSSFVLICLLSLVPTIAEAQRSRATLERSKQESLRRISESERILSKVYSIRKASLEQLNTINQQIDAHINLIKALSEELLFISGEISETSQVTAALKNDLANLRAEYAQMVFWAYKNRSGINQLTFLFSSESFRQLFLRMKYLTHYAEQRRIQLEAIQKVQKSLSLQQGELRDKKNNQEKIVREEKRRRAKLLSLKKDKEEILQQLGKQSKDLRRSLKSERAAIGKLDLLIKESIAREATKKTSISPAAYKHISDRFAKQKNKLSWPVSSGIVISKFGRQRHPVFKSIEQNNIGIEIQTPKSVSVHAVFDGVVSEIALIPGMNSVVIVQHGDYRTVYARLSQVSVSKGQSLKRNQQIAASYVNPSGSSALHFEVWHNTEKLNPEAWLRRR